MADTKQKLLNISLQLMMSKGYNATSVEEICQIAELTKGAFFYHFKSKEILGVNTLQYYWQLRQQQFANTDWAASASPLEQIQGFLLAVRDVFMTDPNGYSCLAGFFSLELATTNPTFQHLVSALFTEWAEQIKPVLRSAHASGAMRSDIDLDLLADHIIVVIEGALVLAVARQDRSVIAQQVNLLISHLQSLF